MNIFRDSGVLSDLQASVEGVVKQTVHDLFTKPVVLYKIRVSCLRRLEGDRVVRDEWCIMRRYNDFVGLHRNLKEAITDQNPKLRELSCMLGDGTGARMKLLPSLPPKKSMNVGVGGVSSKFLEQRGRKVRDGDERREGDERSESQKG